MLNNTFTGSTIRVLSPKYIRIIFDTSRFQLMAQAYALSLKLIIQRQLVGLESYQGRRANVHRGGYLS